MREQPHQYQLAPWAVATVTSVAVVALVTVTVSVVWTVSFPFVAAVGTLLFVQTVLFRHVETQASRASGPQPFTLASLITVLRGTAIIFLAGFVITGRPAGELGWLPALLFAVGTGLDSVDGVVARAMNATSAFGGRLDVEVDALALLLGSLLAIRFGAAPLYFVAIGLARYVFVGMMVSRRYRGKPIHPLPARQSRRVLGAAQMLVVFVLLIPVLESHITRWLAIASMVPFLLGFVRDWLLVTGFDT